VSNTPTAKAMMHFVAFSSAVPALRGPSLSHSGSEISAEDMCREPSVGDGPDVILSVNAAVHRDPTEREVRRHQSEVDSLIRCREVFANFK
jgi:hypothetical protein